MRLTVVRPVVPWFMIFHHSATLIELHRITKGSTAHFAMRRLTLILVFLTFSLSARAAGWVYMGNYPYLYDHGSAKWTYSPAPVIWHQDIHTGYWYNIGTAPANLAPENVMGREVRIYSTLEGLYYYLSFSTYDPIYGTATVDGYSFNFYYHYKKITNNQAQIIAYDGGQAYDYTLLFDDASSGYWDGSSIDLYGVYDYYGSFDLIR